MNTVEAQFVGGVMDGKTLQVEASASGRPLIHFIHVPAVGLRVRDEVAEGFPIQVYQRRSAEPVNGQWQYVCEGLL